MPARAPGILHWSVRHVPVGRREAVPRCCPRATGSAALNPLRGCCRTFARVQAPLTGAARCDRRCTRATSVSDGTSPLRAKAAAGRSAPRGAGTGRPPSALREARHREAQPRRASPRERGAPGAGSSAGTRLYSAQAPRACFEHSNFFEVTGLAHRRHSIKSTAGTQAALAGRPVTRLATDRSTEPDIRLRAF